MKVTREGAKLSIDLLTSVGWLFTFNHTCGSDGVAAVMQESIQRRLDSTETYTQERVESLRRQLDARDRSIASLRGHITRLKRRKP